MTWEEKFGQEQQEQSHKPESQPEAPGGGYEGSCGNAAGDGEQPADYADSQGSAEEIEQLRQQLRDAEAKRDEYLRLAQRLQADFENFKRRAERQRFETVQKANEDLIQKLFPLLDDLERALNTSEPEADPQSILEGVRLIYRQFLEVLAKEGVEPIEAVGQTFDPQKHEAVMQEPCADQPEGTVLEEYRRGYCLRDRVIRPCMVKVAVAPSDQPAGEEPPAGESGESETTV